MVRSSLLVSLIVLGIPTVYSQSPSGNSTGPSCSFSEVYRSEGWTVPGLDKVKAKGERSKLNDLPGVFVTGIRPSEPETFFMDVSCPYDRPGRLVIENAPIKILYLWTFDFGGHVFAYRVSFAREVLKNGARSELGASSAVFFYDIDGSGRFSVMRGATTGAGYYEPDFVPSWAKSGPQRAPGN